MTIRAVPDICLDTRTQSYKNHSIGYHDTNNWNYKTDENQNIDVHAFVYTSILWFKFIR